MDLQVASRRHLGETPSQLGTQFTIIRVSSTAMLNYFRNPRRITGLVREVPHGGIRVGAAKVAQNWPGRVDSEALPALTWNGGCLDTGSARPALSSGRRCRRRMRAALGAVGS